MHMVQCVKYALRSVAQSLESHYLELNAKPYKLRKVKEKLASMGLVQLDHTPSSPDLAPCDFWLFDGFKNI